MYLRPLRSRSVHFTSVTNLGEGRLARAPSCTTLDIRQATQRDQSTRRRIRGTAPEVNQTVVSATEGKPLEGRDGRPLLFREGALTPQRPRPSRNC